MVQRIRNMLVVWGSLLLAIIGISLVLYFTQTPSMRPVTMFFPSSNGAVIQAERQLVPAQVSLETQLEYTVHGIIQGPLSMRYQRLLPADTRVQAVFLAKNELFIDFSNEALLLKKDVPLKPIERLALIERIIFFNFADIKSVYFLINGKSAEFKSTIAELDA